MVIGSFCIYLMIWNTGFLSNMTSPKIWIKFNGLFSLKNEPRNAATMNNISHRDKTFYDDTFRYWPFVRGIHQSPVNSPHKGQWHGALMFTLICARIKGWVNNPEAGDLRCHHAHYDVIVMSQGEVITWTSFMCNWYSEQGIHRLLVVSQNKGSVIWNSDVICAFVILNKHLNTQSHYPWFEMPEHSCDFTVIDGLVQAYMPHEILFCIM